MAVPVLFAHAHTLLTYIRHFSGTDLRLNASMCVFCEPSMAGVGLKKALAASAMILARASEADRTMTLKRIKSKAIDVTDQKLVDFVIPVDPPAAPTALASLEVSHCGMLRARTHTHAHAPSVYLL